MPIASVSFVSILKDKSLQIRRNDVRDEYHFPLSDYDLLIQFSLPSTIEAISFQPSDVSIPVRSAILGSAAYVGEDMAGKSRICEMGNSWSMPRQCVRSLIYSLMSRIVK